LTAKEGRQGRELRASKRGGYLEGSETRDGKSNPERHEEESVRE
jgi:hypothetical protein